MTAPEPQYVPDAIVFLEKHFGAKFSLLDPEGDELGVRVRAIAADELEAVLRGYTNAIKNNLYFRQKRAMRIYVGGPLNGKPNGGGLYPGQIRCVHVARAQWAVYQGDRDMHRAWFRGIATSRRNARRLKFVNAKAGGGS